MAFARYWFVAWDWAYRTSSTDLLRKHSARTCSDCAILISKLDRIRSRRETFRGGHISVRKVAPAPNDSRNGAEKAVDVTVAQTPLEIVTNAGKIVSREPATARITFRLWLRWVRGGWIVVQKGHVV